MSCKRTYAYYLRSSFHSGLGDIAMIELEKKFPSDAVLEHIANALKIDHTELFSKACKAYLPDFFLRKHPA